MPYTTVYDMSKGALGLSQALSNSIANYNLANSKASSGSGLGTILGAASNLGNLGLKAYGTFKGGGTP